MKYPVICLNDKNNDKFFLIPTNNTLLSYANTISGMEEDLLNEGRKNIERVFESIGELALVEKECRVFEVRGVELDGLLKVFSSLAEMDKKDYEMFVLMDKTPLSEISEKDVDTLNKMIKIIRDQPALEYWSNVKNNMKLH